MTENQNDFDCDMGDLQELAILGTGLVKEKIINLITTESM